MYQTLQKLQTILTKLCFPKPQNCTRQTLQKLQNCIPPPEFLEILKTTNSYKSKLVHEELQKYRSTPKIIKENYSKLKKKTTHQLYPKICHNHWCSTIQTLSKNKCIFSTCDYSATKTV